jgi:hypothetical protein
MGCFAADLLAVVLYFFGSNLGVLVLLFLKKSEISPV